jgi:hypothetical protein
MSELSGRASLARSNWKGERARAVVSTVFESHDQRLVGEWCDFEQSVRLTEGAERLGSSPARVIQRWPAGHQLTEILSACAGALGTLNEINVLIMDQPDAGWVRVRADLLSFELARAAAEWMTDGFIAFDPVTESLLSADVEQGSGSTFVETTVIGDGFGGLRQCLREGGPAPLSIVDPVRRHPAG